LSFTKPSARFQIIDAYGIKQAKHLGRLRFGDDPCIERRSRADGSGSGREALVGEPRKASSPRSWSGRRIGRRHRLLRRVFADAGYAGDKLENALARLGKAAREGA